MLLPFRGPGHDPASTRRPRRLTYERVASTLALFLVLAGGTAYAGSKLITGKQIAKGTITAKNVKSHSLLSLDFASGQLPRGAQGPKGDPGGQGNPGQKGDHGDPGTAAASGILLVDGTSHNAEWQSGTNNGFPSNPIRKSAGDYCIPLPSGVDGDTVAAILTPDGTPSIDVQVTATNCADTTHWIEVVTYGTINITGASPPTSGIENAFQDEAVNVALP
jgi:hypothetical protein